MGIDHMYLLISAWRRTDIRANVEDRISEAYRACSISIIIMSLTDLLVFCIGSASVFLSVRYFCAASGKTSCIVGADWRGHCPLPALVSCLCLCLCKLYFNSNNVRTDEGLQNNRFHRVRVQKIFTGCIQHNTYIYI